MEMILFIIGGFILLIVAVLGTLRLLMGVLWFLETVVDIVTEPPFFYLLLPFYLIWQLISWCLSFLGRLINPASPH